jgi:type IV pilus assembly protein PilC
MQFKYRATSINGEYKTGYRSAKNYEELIAILRRDNLFCISYEEYKTIKNNQPIAYISSKDLSLFCKFMATSLKAGMNICDILNLISCQFNNKYFSSILTDIRENIENGNSLNGSLNRFPKVFPVFLRKMVYLGEETGRLQDIFFNLEGYYQCNYKRNKKIINSLIYPSFVFLFSLIIGTFMIIKILPKFMTQIINLGGDLPSITKFYLSLGNFLNDYGAVTILLIGISVTIICYVMKSFLCVKDFTSLILKIPLLKTIIKKCFYTRFSYSMFTLLSSGLDMVSSLDIVVNFEKSYYFNKRLLNCIKTIEKGDSVQMALDSADIFPKFFITMIGIGEENGTLEEMLRTSSEIFEDDLNSTLDKASVLIEPILILVLGGFIATIVLAIMMPLFDLSTRGF